MQYEEDIVPTYGEETIGKCWLRVCKELKTVTDEIAEK